MTSTAKVVHHFTSPRRVAARYLIGYHRVMNPSDARRVEKMASALRTARQRSGLSLRELARRAGTSHPTLLAYEKGQKTPTVTTFLRVLAASGFAVDFELSPRIRHAGGLERGRELAEVLALAAQFPARHARRIPYPRFPRR